MNRIDLDELERKALATVNGAYATVINGPITLALIARIRELELALHEALNYWSADMPDDDKHRDRLRKIAEKGAS